MSGDRLDVMPELLQAVRAGRARVVSRRPYEVNGRSLVELEIEWPDQTDPTEERP